MDYLGIVSSPEKTIHVPLKCAQVRRPDLGIPS